jgi:hypothetical protein
LCPTNTQTGSTDSSLLETIIFVFFQAILQILSIFTIPSSYSGTNFSKIADTYSGEV